MGEAKPRQDRFADYFVQHAGQGCFAYSPLAVDDGVLSNLVHRFQKHLDLR
jgi:hypothetical protein